MVYAFDLISHCILLVIGILIVINMKTQYNLYLKNLQSIVFKFS